VGPLIRAWLSCREWVSVYRGADPGPIREVVVFADLVDRIDAEARPVVGDLEVRDASLPGKSRYAS
jgi:hypothetical protein